MKSTTPTAHPKQQEGTATQLAYTIEYDCLVASGWPFGEAIYIIRDGAWVLIDNTLGFDPGPAPDWCEVQYRNPND